MNDKCCLFCGNSMSADAADGSHILICLNCKGLEGKEIIVDEDEYCGNFNQ